MMVPSFEFDILIHCHNYINLLKTVLLGIGKDDEHYTRYVRETEAQ